MFPNYISLLEGIILFFTSPIVTGMGILSAILMLTKKNKNIKVNIWTFLFSSFFLGGIILVFFYTISFNILYLIAFLLISLVLALYSLRFLKNIIYTNLRSYDMLISLIVAVLGIIVLLYHLKDEFSYPYGYFMPYLLVPLTILNGDPLKFNSYAYLMYAHCFLTTSTSITGVDPVIFLSMLPYIFVGIYIIGFYIFSREYGLPIIIGMLIAVSSIFIIHSATGVLLYYSQRTLLLLISPFYLIYYMTMDKRSIPWKVYIINTIFAPYLMLTMALLDSSLRQIYVMISIMFFFFFSYHFGNILGLIDSIITAGFLFLHIFEALPFIFLRLFSPILGNHAPSNYKRKYTVNFIVLIFFIFLFSINLLPLLNLFNILDSLSISVPLSLARMGVEPFGFKNSFDAWKRWISYTLGSTLYYAILVLDLIAILWILIPTLRSLNVKFYGNGIAILFIPGIILALILLIRIGEVFRFLDLITPFFLTSIIFITKLVFSKKIKIHLVILSKNKFLNFYIKRILILIIIIFTYMQYEYGILRYRDYVYINNYRYFTKTDQLLINFIKNNYNIKRSFSLNTYKGPLIVSDPYTMLTLYYATLVEPCMEERGWITPTAYSNQSLYHLKLLKIAMKERNVNDILNVCISSVLLKENCKITKILIIINWRTIDWLGTDTIMYTPLPGYVNKALENSSKAIADYVKSLIKDSELHLVKEMNNTYIFEIDSNYFQTICYPS
jgi:hypothetical protein